MVLIKEMRRQDEFKISLSDGRGGQNHLDLLQAVERYREYDLKVGCRGLVKLQMHETCNNRLINEETLRINNLR